MPSEPIYPPGISPIPWSRPHALRWQGRLAAKVSWVGIYAVNQGKGSLPVHSIKPKDIPDSQMRVADAELMASAPELFALLFAALPYLPPDLADQARRELRLALGTQGPSFGLDMPQFNDLV